MMTSGNASAEAWRTHLSVAGVSQVHFVEGAAFDTSAVVRAGTDLGFAVFELDGSRMQARNDVMDELATVLRFPSYFGRNWNAVQDFLTDLSWAPATGYLLIVAAADPLLRPIGAVMRSVRHLFLATIAGAMMMPSSLTASSEEDLVSVRLVMADVDDLPVPPIGFRAYAESPRLVFGLNVFNESVVNTVWVDQAKLRDAFAILVERDREIATIVNWTGVTVGGVASGVPIFSDDSVALEPRGSAVWSVAVERVDGQPFTSGEYVVTFGTVNIRAALRTTDGGPWRGRIPEGIGQWTLVVRGPATDFERARLHELAGNAAFGRGAYADALAQYLKELELDPANLGIMAMIGHMHLRLGQFRDAATWLEQAAGGSLNGKGLARPLASAYLGAGDEPNAIRVLRLSGTPESRVSDELGILRREVRDQSR